jgi:hypothetical protein
VPCDPLACHLSLGQVSLAGSVRGDGAAGRARSSRALPGDFPVRIPQCDFGCAYTC